MTGKVKKIVVAGVMGGLTIFLGVTHLGFIPWFSGASLTIMHVPVIIGSILEGPVVGTVIGLIFGVFSLLQAAIAPTGPADVWFTNPLISVVPRLFIGFVSWLIYKISRPIGDVFGYVTAGIAGSLTNTVLVLGILGLYKYLPLNLIKMIALVNGLPEAAISAILTLFLVLIYYNLEDKIKEKFKGSRI